MLSCLIGPVFICGSLDFRDEASRRTVEIGLSRTLAAVEELNAEEFLPNRPRVFSVGNAASALSAGTVRAYRKNRQPAPRLRPENPRGLHFASHPVNC